MIEYRRLRGIVVRNAYPNLYFSSQRLVDI